MARRNGRQRGQLPPCYHEGYLEKRSFKNKTSRKLWSRLCGNVLYLYNDKRDVDFVQRVDLSRVISIVDDNSSDRNLKAARFTVTTKDGNFKLTAPNAEAREQWKGYILSVSELSVPSSLNLLPGQLHVLKEVVEQEKERMKSVPPRVFTSRSFDSSDTDLPPCFHIVSRLEAELLLEKESKKGNLLLRPGSEGNSFSITTRQEDHNSAIFRHYRVSRNLNGGYAIALENPVPCDTLHGVVNYLVEKTGRVLVPLILEEQYEKSIFFIQSDNENGERSVQEALPDIVLPSLPPKPVALKIPTTEQAAAPFVEPVNELGQIERHTEEDSVTALSQIRKAPTIKPPLPAPRKSLSTASTPSLTSSTNREQRIRPHTDPLGQTISQLKLMFEQKAKVQE